MTYTVELTPSAIEDIQNIYDYIAYTLESVINADSQISRIQVELIVNVLRVIYGKMDLTKIWG